MPFTSSRCPFRVLTHVPRSRSVSSSHSLQQASLLTCREGVQMGVKRGSGGGQVAVIKAGGLEGI
eukprot:6049771-Pyramimonas_sp.AAC.1